MNSPPTKAEIDEYARTHGFPDSDYPYAEHINTCGSNDFSSIVPDGWYCVSFANACRNHDRCYITLGSSREACDKNFRDCLLYTSSVGGVAGVEDVVEVGQGN